MSMKFKKNVEYVFNKHTRNLLGEFFSRGQYPTGTKYVKFIKDNELTQINEEDCLVTTSLNPIWVKNEDSEVKAV